MKKIFIFLLFLSIPVAAFVGWWYGATHKSAPIEIKSPVKIELPRPLRKYSIPQLQQTSIEPVELDLEEMDAEPEDFTSYTLTFEFDPTLSGKTEKKKVTGLINIPDTTPAPIVLMLRGYVDPSIYQTGVGTWRAAQVFAKAGFITIAPDFLGYDGSHENASDIFESRFQTYTTALVLLKSITNPNTSIPEWDNRNVFIWAHSNGGQIALTLLEVTKENYPTTLWAPVTKPFPYSILYYTDESEDLGKFIRSQLADFEELYDVNQFSIHSYFNDINAPLQIHQGTADDAIPLEWSREFVAILDNLEKDITYYIYPGSDHNLKPAWDTVVARDIQFFQSKIQPLP